MPLTQDVIDAAPELAAAVVRDWGAPALQWSDTPEPIDEDHLAELIQQLGNAALAREAGTPGPSRDLIRVALRHGHERREDGFTEEMLFREYHLLRRGLWEALKRRARRRLASETIIRLDAEITMATSASLRGFHLEREEIEEESLVDGIAERWSS